MLLKCCAQYASKYGKLSSGHKTEEDAFIPDPKKGNAKLCLNYHTIALIAHASKVELKILWARLQYYVNREFPDVQTGFRKGRGTRNQIANIQGFPDSSDGKASAYNAGDLGSIPGSERSPGERNGNPLQYSHLENPIDWQAWWATVHGVAKSRTCLSNFTFNIVS